MTRVATAKMRASVTSAPVRTRITKPCSGAFAAKMTAIAAPSPAASPVSDIARPPSSGVAIKPTSVVRPGSSS